jgi:hypothetical protein
MDRESSSIKLPLALPYILSTLYACENSLLDQLEAGSLKNSYNTNLVAHEVNLKLKIKVSCYYP